MPGAGVFKVVHKSRLLDAPSRREEKAEAAGEDKLVVLDGRMRAPGRSSAGVSDQGHLDVPVHRGHGWTAASDIVGSRTGRLSCSGWRPRRRTGGARADF